MSLKLPSIRGRIERLIKDKAKRLDREDINEAIKGGLRVFSMAYPYQRVSDKSGDGSVIEWAVPTDWYPEFSVLEKVGHPIDETGEREPPWLDPKYDYDVIQKDSGWVWRLLRDTPATGETARFIYTTIHVLTDAASSLSGPPSESQVVFISAALCCMQIAALMANRREDLIEGDISDHTVAVQHYRDLAATYAQMSGLKDFLESGFADEEIACHFRDVDLDPMFSSAAVPDYLFHTRKRR